VPPPDRPTDPSPDAAAVSDADRRLARLLAPAGRRERLTPVERVAGREGRPVRWPQWVHRDLVDALVKSGVDEPWSHQVEAAEHVRAGRSAVVSTGTASG
jgi:DEAD/DEAH box helicase domain-containing protein